VSMVCNKPGSAAAWIAPQYKFLEEDFEELSGVLTDVIRRRQIDRKLTLNNGSVIEFWSADQEQAENICRGREYDLMIINEAAMIGNLVRLWNVALRPALISRQGRAMIGSTPKGRNGFWQLGERHTKFDDWGLIRQTSFQNPFNDPRELLATRDELTDMEYRQEILAEAHQTDGAVFKNVEELSTLLPLTGPQVGSAYLAGVDWGRYQDRTVLSVVDVTKRRQAFVRSWGDTDYLSQADEIAKICRHYRVGWLEAEQNAAGDVVISVLRRMGIRVHPHLTTLDSKQVLIDSLQFMLEKKTLTLLNLGVQKDELKAYEQRTTKVGHVTYGAPEGQHDDHVMALALSVRSLRDRPSMLAPRRYTVNAQMRARGVRRGRMLMRDEHGVDPFSKRTLVA